MDIETFRTYCLQKPFVTEEFPFGPETLVFKVKGKIFALTGLDEQAFKVNLKADPEFTLELRDQYHFVLPGYHMNKRLWNTVVFDECMDDLLLYRLIDHSFDQVVSGLAKRDQNIIRRST